VSLSLEARRCSTKLDSVGHMQLHRLGTVLAAHTCCYIWYLIGTLLQYGSALNAGVVDTFIFTVFDPDSA